MRRPMFVLRRKGTSSPQLSSKGCKPKTLQVSIYLHKSERWTRSFTSGKRRCPTTLGTVWLANNAQSTGPILSSEPCTCFTILFRVKFDDHSIKVSALLDSEASACFINKDFAECHKLPLVTKKWPVSVEVIDGRPLVFGDVTQETKALDIYIDQHRSTVVLNVIKSPSNPVILGLSWLDRYNPDIDWKKRRIEFKLEKIESPNMQKLGSPSHLKPKVYQSIVTSKTSILMIGARAFVKATRQGATYMIYANSIIESNEKSSGLPDQYKEYQDDFEKKNAYMLPQHRPYDYGIDLQEGTQPPFGPIYSLSQNELAALREYLDENLAKNFI